MTDYRGKIEIQGTGEFDIRSVRIYGQGQDKVHVCFDGYGRALPSQHNNYFFTTLSAAVDLAECFIENGYGDVIDKKYESLKPFWVGTAETFDGDGSVDKEETE